MIKKVSKIFILFLICFNSNLLFSQNYFIDDFNDGSAPTLKNGGYSIWAGVDITPDHVETDAFRKKGKSLKFSYDTSIQFDLWINLNETAAPMDITVYDYMSFWIRGENGGEIIEIQLQNGVDAYDQVQINMFLPGGRVSKSWQKVVIPVITFNGGGFDRSTVKTLHILGGNSGWTNTSGTVYIDDLLLGTGIGTHYIDTMEMDEDHIWGWPDLTSYSVAIESGANGDGIVTKSNTLNTDQDAYKGNGSYKLFQGRSTTASGDVYCNWVLDYGGLDMRAVNKFSFAVKADTVKTQGEGPRVYIDDGAPYDDWVAMKAVTTNWSLHEYDISSFPGLNLLDVKRVCFHTRDETALTNLIWIDEIRFVDSIAPVAAPRILSINGEAFTNNYNLKATNVITVEADSETTDRSIEGVFLEYSYDGGNSWFWIHTDYFTGTTKTVYTNIWVLEDLLENTVYSVRAGSFDSSDNRSYSQARTIANLMYGNKIKWDFNPFSPNGDGKRDQAVLSVLTPVKQEAIRVSIYDINGDLVKELSKAENSGIHQFIWDGKDFNNRCVPVGPYIYQVRYGTYVYNGVIVVVK